MAARIDLCNLLIKGVQDGLAFLPNPAALGDNDNVFNLATDLICASCASNPLY